jgi:hypothetical protein
MRPATTRSASTGGPLSLLTLERPITGPLIHLIYWSGLGLLAIGGMGAVGATVGIALSEGSILGVLLSLVTLAVGLAVLLVFALIWRAVCEFFVAIFQISQDLHLIRLRQERDGAA